MTRVGWARRRPPALCPHGVLPDACVECLRRERDEWHEARDINADGYARCIVERDRLRAEVERLRDALDAAKR